MMKMMTMVISIMTNGRQYRSKGCSCRVSWNRVHLKMGANV